MARHPWELSDEFWRLVEPLIPRWEREKGRKAGGGVESHRPGKKGGAKRHVLVDEQVPQAAGEV